MYSAHTYQPDKFVCLFACLCVCVFFQFSHTIIIEKYYNDVGASSWGGV